MKKWITVFLIMLWVLSGCASMESMSGTQPKISDSDGRSQDSSGDVSHNYSRNNILGKWNYLSDVVIKEGLYPILDIYEDGTFNLYVNLYEGMGNIWGTYSIKNDSIEFHVSSRDFKGFIGDDVSVFFCWIYEETLIYKGEQIGTLIPDAIFER